MGELHILDKDVSIELNYSDHQVFFEQGCVHNKMQPYQIRCTSEFGEIYTISRQHVMETVEHVRFGHGKHKCEVTGVVGNFEPIYETKAEKKARKKAQKQAKAESQKRVSNEAHEEEEALKKKQEEYEAKKAEMKTE